MFGAGASVWAYIVSLTSMVFCGLVVLAIIAVLDQVGNIGE